MSIVLIDATSSSLTVSWPPTDGAKSYLLQYKKAGGDGGDFQLLSDKLTQPQARKRNLEYHPEGYLFRAGAVLDGGTSPTSWATHDTPFLVLTADQEKLCMQAPTVSDAGSNQAITVSWNAFAKEDGSNVAAYELQMRENKGGEPWKTIAGSVMTTGARKKNLASKLGYQFRVRPAGDAGHPFSPASEVIVAVGLSEGIRQFFSSLEDQTLLRSGVAKPVPLAEALGGKEFVLLYASAHWCPPCRQFTPMLANWYQTVKSMVEVVFLSCDHDENQFKNYFATHPWMAVDFDDDAREQLLAAIRVQGIPRLVVLSAKTGKIIVDNAVGQPLDINRWRTISG
jgi:thiol-disulfide isomerase/thioredoxin